MKRAASKGQALLIAVLLLIAVATFGAIIAGSTAGGDITASAYQGSSVEALYAAESGLDRALKQYDGTNCASLPATDVSAGVSGRSFTTTSFTTDFDGANFPPTSLQCRVKVVGKVAATGQTRIIQAIIDKSAIGSPSVNADFNIPSGTGSPTAWSTGATTKYDYTGGPDPSGSAPTSCKRAAYAVKTNTSTTQARTSGTVTTNFTVTGGASYTMYFDYRVQQIASSGSDTCTVAAAVPVTCTPPSAGNRARFCFRLSDGTAFSFLAGSAGTSTRSVTGPSCLPTTQAFPADYATCSFRYNNNASPYSTGRASVTFSPAASSTITSLTWYIRLKTDETPTSGRPKEAWLDNIQIVPATIESYIDQWRDCAVSSCP